MSDPDDIDEVLRDFHRFARRRVELPPIDEGAFEDVPQIEDDYVFAPEDELILGDDYVTYLVFAEAHEIDDFSISMEQDSIEVKTEDFILKKALGMRVEHEDPTATYSNGVLSVKLRRIGIRDAVA